MIIERKARHTKSRKVLPVDRGERDAGDSVRVVESKNEGEIVRAHLRKRKSSDAAIKVGKRKVGIGKHNARSSDESSK